jgi:hypothetical protein
MDPEPILVYGNNRPITEVKTSRQNVSSILKDFKKQYKCNGCIINEENETKILLSGNKIHEWKEFVNKNFNSHSI